MDSPSIPVIHFNDLAVVIHHIWNKNYSFGSQLLSIDRLAGVWASWFARIHKQICGPGQMLGQLHWLAQIYLWLGLSQIKGESLAIWHISDVGVGIRYFWLVERVFCWGGNEQSRMGYRYYQGYNQNE